MTEKNQKYYPTINQSFWLIAKLILISIPASIPLIIFMIFKDDLGEDSIFKSIALLFSYAITFFWIIKIARTRVKKQGLWEIKWKKQKVSIGSLGIFLIMTLAVIIIIDPITELIPMPESFIKVFEDMIQPNIFSFLTIVVLAPFFEELLFRGIILEAFLKNYSPWKAIIWSAIIFGTAHFNPWQTIGASLAGIFIGWAYVKTNSLIPGIMIHFVNNLIGFSIMIFSQNNSLYLSDFIDSPLLHSILIIISIITVITGGILINKQKAINNVYSK